MAAVVGNLPVVTVNNATDNYFTNFFKSAVSVDPNVNEAVIGFFQTFTGDKETGNLLAASVIYTASTRGVDPMSIVDELRRLKTGKKTEVKTPVDSAMFNSSYNSYQNANADRTNYTPGQLFYIPLLNVFYELTENYRLIASTKYKAELVTGPQIQEPIYNYYEVQYNFEENELNAYLCMFLNLDRVNTSLLGINNSPKTNKYIQRAILP